MPYQQTDKTYILHKFFKLGDWIKTNFFMRYFFLCLQLVTGLKRTFLWGISFCAYNYGHMLEAPKGLFDIPDLSE